MMLIIDSKCCPYRKLQICTEYSVFNYKKLKQSIQLNYTIKNTFLIDKIENKNRSNFS